MLNIKKLALLALPTFLRKPLLGAMVQAMVRPLADQQRRLIDYRQEVEARLKRNGQVCYLRRLLNDTFDATLRGIYITDAEEEPEENRQLFCRSEDRPIFLAKTDSDTRDHFILNSRTTAGANAIDFEVHVPWYLLPLGGTGGEALIEAVSALTWNYRLAGKRYRIVPHYRPRITTK